MQVVQLDGAVPMQVNATYASKESLILVQTMMAGLPVR